MGLLDDLNDILSGSADDATSHTMQDPILSDDLWKKFSLEFPDILNIEELLDELYSYESNLLFTNQEDHCKIISHHDCMWAGQCASEEHPDLRQTSNNLSSPMNILASDTREALALDIKQENKPQMPSQQSLLKPTVRAAASTKATMMPLMHNPLSPPMSDDEESKCKPMQMLPILNDTISERDLGEDSDLCEYRAEYFEDDDEDFEANVSNMDPSVEEDFKPNITTCQFAAENDHSYHKDKNNASMHMPNLGIDTPSDSEEEEIDVVSVTDGEIISINTKITSLPTNPSVKDRQQIQRRMATAITTNKISGIKTILPIRKTNVDNSNLKKKLKESRSAKRPRPYRTAPSGSNPSYKKRTVTGNSSDSEAEPSEKRSLHNNMERQRRIDLRNAFEDLRLLVPEVSRKEKAAKVVILREASRYCGFLERKSSDCTDLLNNLRRQQEELRTRVSQLRRSLAAIR